MSTSQQKARRKGGSRSKGGCGKCRARHLKCDETKPYCRRCSETGMACDGYPTGVLKNQMTIALIAPPIAAYAIPFRIPGSQQDRRLLHYYCVQGAEDLSGHLKSEFWTRLVLQHSYNNISVRQAVVALSCAHQNYTTTNNSGNLTPPDAMVHYSKAMRSLRKYMSAGIDDKGEVSAMVPLICSVLFSCFENTQGNTEAASRHLSSGIAILARYKEGVSLIPDSRKPEHLDLLEQTLTRLDLQASMFDDARPLLTQLDSTVEFETLASSTFKTINDAQADLTRMQNRTLQFLISNNTFKYFPECSLPEKLKMEKQAIEETYAKWNEKLNQYSHDQLIPSKARGGYHSRSEGDRGNGHPTRVLETEVARDPGVAILRIYYQVFQLLLAANFPYDPSVFSGLSNSVNVYKLNRILDLIESTHQAQGEGSRSLAAETGIIAPLFLVVVKCTDPAIFKRAFDLLLALSGRREGMFDGRVLVEIALRFMAQYQTSYSPAALEWRFSNAFDESVNGLDGVARNLGIIP
ncbi:hypothetical protein F4825DRAFT_461816 [Nemania diffusa]|nr:hypothetical protein F4825DRAFT_461816 [Nemania diffusa]